MAEVESNGEIARRGYQAVVEGDLEAVRAFLDPDVKWHGGAADGPGSCQNREQAMRFVSAARAKDRVGRLIEIIDAGEKVVVIMEPPGGGRTSNVTTFRAGMAVEIVHYPDPNDARVAAGLAPVVQRRY
jgi:ketosteroid isomerase-like protein